MPRSPNPALEKKVVAAAIRLLDRGGEAAVTLRAVAKEAGTTTPTIYQRFRDRGELLQSVIDRATAEVVALLEPKATIESIFREYLRHSCAHPMRVGLTVSTFGQRYVAGEPMPAFELLKSRIASQIGLKGRAREDLALAIATLALGTAQGMIATGNKTRHAAELRRTSVQALRMLLAAFSRRRKPRIRVDSSRQ